MSNGTYEDFRNALRAFESGWDRDRYDAGIIQDWQLDQWAGYAKCQIDFRCSGCLTGYGSTADNTCITNLDRTNRANDFGMDRFLASGKPNQHDCRQQIM